MQKLEQNELVKYADDHRTNCRKLIAKNSLELDRCKNLLNPFSKRSCLDSVNENLKKIYECVGWLNGYSHGLDTGINILEKKESE